ncbi:MAG: hypothetical protein CL920_27090 [Deltaproteobacteria bacterium]|nr:hypothetical protein [Deltaproteobacteria bacterium]MBU52376.1 hypothetical protein [Deltaproteobacteria bacterium]
MPFLKDSQTIPPMFRSGIWKPDTNRTSFSNALRCIHLSATQGVASTLKTCRFSWIEWLMTAILDGRIEGFDGKRTEDGCHRRGFGGWKAPGGK